MQKKNRRLVFMEYPTTQYGKLLRSLCIAGLVIGLCGVCFHYKDSITVENIAALAPENTFLAALVMLLLFAVKSVVVFVYSGILYAVNGILFSLPTAILLNIAGTVIMITIPFLIGRKCGFDLLEKLAEKYPKLKKIQEIQNSNTFLVTLLVRIIGIVPATLVGIYFGASDDRFCPYLSASLIGMLPGILSFSIMGTSIQDVTSPTFLMSVCFELFFVLVSVGISAIWKRRNSN